MLRVSGMPGCVSVPSRFERMSERLNPLALSSTKYGPSSPSGMIEQLELLLLLLVVVVVVVDVLVPQLTAMVVAAAAPNSRSAIRRSKRPPMLERDFSSPSLFVITCNRTDEGFRPRFTKAAEISRISARIGLGQPLNIGDEIA